MSVVVPVLNELAQLSSFMENLARQQEIEWELIFCDGGSTDGSLEFLQQQGCLENVRIIVSAKGRGRQLNHALAMAQAPWLLLLHVDSRFADPLAFRKGIACLEAAAAGPVAGHYALEFRLDSCRPASGFGYYFYTCKARLGRQATVHGDQGFLFRRGIEQMIGLFREDLPAMEDTDFADRFAARGRWLLLPAVISTSARRFESEGLWQRQLLGALMMCFRSIGWDEYWEQAPAVYRQQQETARLDLLPFLRLVRRLLAAKPLLQRWQIWYRSGCYVRQHGWQLLLLLDCHKAYRQGLAPGDISLQQLRLWESFYERVTDHLLGRIVVTMLLRGGFAALELLLVLRRGRSL